MNTPVPARAHANMPVSERELTFDALLAEFGEFRPDDAAPPASIPTARRVLTRPSAEVLKLSGLIALAVLSLTWVFIALAG